MPIHVSRRHERTIKSFNDLLMFSSFGCFLRVTLSCYDTNNCPVDQMDTNKVSVYSRRSKPYVTSGRHVLQLSFQDAKGTPGR